MSEVVAINQDLSTDDVLDQLADLVDAIRPSLTWRVLVLPQQPRRQSAGRHGAKIELPDGVMDAERYTQYIGRILAIGPLAGKSDKFLPADFRDRNLSGVRTVPYEWPYKEGDWVAYARYAGARMTYFGVELFTVNDDELLGVIPGPEGFKVYV